MRIFDEVIDILKLKDLKPKQYNNDLKDSKLILLS